MIQGVLLTVSADSKLWCCPHVAGFTGMQNAGVAGLGRLPPRFQRKGRKTKKGASERAVYEIEGAAETLGSQKCKEHRPFTEESYRL